MNALTSNALLDTSALSSPTDDAAIFALSRDLLAGETRLADWDADRCEIDPEEAAGLTIEAGRQSTALMQMQPTTLSALATKVEALRLTFRAFVLEEAGTSIESDGQHSDKIAWSVFDDILRLANASPDADLLAACERYLSIQRAFEAAYMAHDGDMEEGHPACALLDPVPGLMNQIVSLRAVTAEGFLARMRCMAFHYMPNNVACQDDPTGADDRFHAATLRDLVQMERGDAA